MGQKQVSVGIDGRVHGLVQFAAKDRKLQRKWPWKQKEIVAVALCEWIQRRLKSGVDLERLAEAGPQRPDEVEEGGAPLPFDEDLFEPGTGTLSFKLAKYVESSFERACLQNKTKKGKAVEKALRAWLRQNGYAEALVVVGVDD